MKIDLNYRFKTLEGKDIPEQGSNLTVEKLLSIETWEEFEKFRAGLTKGKPFTLRKACVNVLLMTEIDGTGRAKELKGEEKVERFELATNIHKCNGLFDMRPEDQVLLKKLIARVYGPLTVGQAWQVLDPHEAAEKKAKKKEKNNTDN